MTDSLREQVEEILAGQRAEEVPAGASGWQLTNDSVKRRLLKHVISTGRRLNLEFSEDPSDEEVPGRWEAIERGIWTVPQEAWTYFADISEWLSYGNWVLYEPLGNPVWRMGAYRNGTGMIQKMRAANVPFCIYSFHDNDPWFVFVDSVGGGE